MARRRILTDPGFWVLIGVNIYLVWYYYHTPEIFTTLIWLYWCQSVMMGIFNFFDMLTSRDPIPMQNSDPQFFDALSANKHTAAVETPSPKIPWRSNTGVSLFFLFHYGFFHFVYMIFLFTMKPRYPINWDLFKYFLGAFFVGQVITFIQHKIRERKTQSNLGAMFFTPYLRILPMHLTILIPSFFHITNLGVFLILKAFADIVMYIVTKPRQVSSKVSDQAILASEQTMNL